MIVEIQQYTARLSDLRQKLAEVGDGLHMDNMERELQELR